LSDQLIELTVNGERVKVSADPSTPLLYVLRNDRQLNGPKYGCGLGECGACTIHIDGKAARSCIVPLRAGVGREITTLEGLGGVGTLHVVQQAFVDEQAAQCGYCLNGMIMTTAAFLSHCTEIPDQAAIKDALKANLCRCGTHVEIIKAVETAAAVLFSSTSHFPDKEV
jgi:nicotinate dehydrogenase subunit A